MLFFNLLLSFGFSILFYFVLDMFINLLAMLPDGSFKIPSAIFFNRSITLPPLAFVCPIKSLIDCITLLLSILFAFEIVEAIRSTNWN